MVVRFKVFTGYPGNTQHALSSRYGINLLFLRLNLSEQFVKKLPSFVDVFHLPEDCVDLDS